MAWQIGIMTIPSAGEVTCNLWSIMGIERVMKVNRTLRWGADRRPMVTTYWASGPDYPNWDAAVGLMHYSSLMEGVGGGDVNAGWVRGARA